MIRVIVTFVIAAFIIYLSYISSKYIGKGMNRTSTGHYMRLVDQITVGQDRYIAILQTGGKYFLVGIASGQISILSELRPEDLTQLSSENGADEIKTPDFREIMEKLGNLRKKGR